MLRLNRWTIGRKIAVGFAMVLGLLAVVAVMAYFAFWRSGQGFAAYSASTGETSMAIQLETTVLQLRLNAGDFISFRRDEALAAYAKNKTMLSVLLDQTSRKITDPERTASLASVRKLFGDYDSRFAQVVALRHKADELNENVLGPKSDNIVRDLSRYLVSARNSNDMNAAYNGSVGVQTYYQAMTYANMFFISGNKEDADNARGYLNVARNNALNLLSELTKSTEGSTATASPETKESLVEADAEIKAYIVAFDELARNYTERDNLAKELNNLAPQFARKLAEIKMSLSSLQNQLANEAKAAQLSNGYLVTIFSGLGLIVGIVSAIVITRGVTAPLQVISLQLTDDSQKTTDAANHVTSASDAMAQGSSRQAASLQETSAALEELASMTQKNANHAEVAKKLAGETRHAADDGASEIREMKSAMDEIKSSGSEISQIIKTIDEIAFQTNILALNAAVEAARAGEAGLGFAVVAEEVRNLAQRSAQAARDTTDKIHASNQRSEHGVKISEKVAGRLAEIITKARQVDDMIREIATACKEQNKGIQEINSAVNDIDRVTQENAAHSEETASFAAQLNGQARSLNLIVEELKQLLEGTLSAD